MTNKFKLLPHTSHNPYCDIVVNKILSDSASVTYGVYVTGPEQGKEFCEYYSGPNYHPTSNPKSKSYSRHWPNLQSVPKAHRAALEAAKEVYNNLKEISPSH